MDYEIDRKTSKFHIRYKPSGPLFISEVTKKGERPYFMNHKWQDDFSYYPNMTNEQVDRECISLVERQAHFPKQPKGGLVALLKNVWKTIFS